ncbi:helix-turn-helix domain-containing protein [Sporosarcina sp. GW1-11]|uniref:PucR family transcriptional regulator n=1 Tax=Sporosarcina sp. GW1-11 TaxID=2899126 RepID=UPI00294C0599|nr:helix-turn-helix domain-containing protein [Sporosarcina sp. GW1-11]MDV6378714.1 helix-turn-helix domain-containing protein [Sporosarcina sp. GW1-11]
MSQLMKKLYMMTDLNDIAELMSIFLQKPIVIENKQFSLLAYSSHQIELFDDANKSTIFTKQWPLSIVEAFMNAGIIQQLETVKGPFRVPRMESIGLNPRTVVSATYNGHVFGYIWVRETDGPLTNEQILFLDEVSVHVGRLLHQENQLKVMEEEKSTRFYKKVINNSFKTQEEMNEAASFLTSAPTSSHAIAIFSLSNKEEEILAELLETTNLFISALNERGILFADGLNIVAVIGTSSSSDDLSATMKQLVCTVLNQFQLATIYAGIGQVYAGLPQIRTSYLEAQTVIQTAQFLGNPSLVPFEYRELGVLRYLKTIAASNHDMNYVNKDLQKLQRKDRESQTELLRTLEVYLTTNCRIKAAAEQLFIHTNTLKYRLKQITEMTSINFGDFSANCQLFIDLQLLKSKEAAKEDLS